MKRNLASLGTALSRDEAKKIVGGYGKLICTCGSSMVTTVCTFSSFVGSLNCASMASSYCSSSGEGSANCNLSW